MEFSFTKEQFLYLKLFDSVKTKQQYEEEIKKYIVAQEKKLFYIKIIDGDFPSYEEYIEYYSKYDRTFLEMFLEQNKQLIEFQLWLSNKKEQTFTYDEIEQKLLDLKLSINGFNADLKF